VIVLNNIYVLYGEEKKLIEIEKDKIVKELISDDNDNNNISKYNLLQTTIDEVIEDAATIPLLSDKKIIIANDAFFLTATDVTSNINHNIDKLIKYINNPNPETTLIFILNHNKLDERKKIVKEIRKKTIIKEFAKLNQKGLLICAKNSFKENGYKIDDDALNLLVNRVENSLEILMQEMDKLMMYKVDEKEIFQVDVDDLVPKPISDNIFDLTNAVVERDLEKTLELYEQLLVRNEEPIKIIVILANQFRLTYQTKRLKKKGYSDQEIADKLGIHPYRIKLASEINLSENTLLNYLEKLADLDIGIKTGKINKDVGLELFFLQL
jgi:DNA polymerase III subunit delta